MAEVYYIGNKAKDYYDFNPTDFDRDNKIGYLQVEKVFKTFVRGKIEFDSAFKKTNMV